MLISVIIPTYNTGRYLSQAVESALCQTHSPVEIVVVNDGSTDNTDEVIAPYLGRIRYICQENRGLSAARNVGFRASRGDFVCFLDADDILLPDKFARQLVVFEREPDLGIVISGYIDVQEDGKTAIQTVAKQWHRDALDHLLNHEVFPPHTALIRRQVLGSVALFPENIDTQESQEDWQLWLDLALKGVSFSSVPEPTCKYRSRKGSIRANRLKHLDGARRVVGWLRTHPQAGKYQARIERLAAIVEMERVAAIWRTGHKDVAAETLATSARESPRFWQEPLTYLRLFERTLTLAESAKWQKQRNLACFERRVIGEILPLAAVRLGAAEYGRLSAAAHLALSDLAYGAGNSSTRRQSVQQALRDSPLECMASSARASLARGIAGPDLVSELRKIELSRLGLAMFGLLMLAYYVAAAVMATIGNPPRFDEAYVLLLTRNSRSFGELWSAIRSGVDQAPLNPLVLKALTQFTPAAPVDLIIARLFSVLCTAAGGVLLYRTVARRFGAWAGLLALVFFQASGFAGFAVLDARQYALATLLGVGAIATWTSNKGAGRWLAAVLMFLGLLTHYFFAFVVLACGLADAIQLVLADLPLRRKAVLAVEITAPLGLCVASFLVVWGGQLVRSAQVLIDIDSGISLTGVLTGLIGWPWVPRLGVTGSIIVSVALLLIMTAWTVIHLRLSVRGYLDLLTRDSLLLVMLILSMSLFPGFFILNDWLRFNVRERYFLFQGIGLNALLGVAVYTFVGKWLDRKYVHLVSGILLLTLAVEMFYPYLRYPQLRRDTVKFHHQVAQIEQMLDRGERVVFDYSRSDAIFFEEMAWDSSEIATRTEAPYSEYWIVDFVKNYMAFFSTPRFTRLSTTPGAYKNAVLISSNPDGAWAALVPGVRFVPIEVLGNAIDGREMTAYRVVEIEPEQSATVR